uniref:Uncharacterized protein n=1 Tax=Arundo donax TaxID=35708 RepID=A0A0A8ZQZ0_ARUDO
MAKVWCPANSVSFQLCQPREEADVLDAGKVAQHASSCSPVCRRHRWPVSPSSLFSDEPYQLQSGVDVPKSLAYSCCSSNPVSTAGVSTRVTNWTSTLKGERPRRAAEQPAGVRPGGVAARVQIQLPLCCSGRQPATTFDSASSLAGTYYLPASDLTLGCLDVRRSDQIFCRGQSSRRAKFGARKKRLVGCQAKVGHYQNWS